MIILQHKQTHTVQTDNKVNACCVCVSCLRVNAWPYCPLRVNMFVLMFSHAHLYFTILVRTYLYSNYILFAGVNLHGLQTSKPGHCRKATTRLRQRLETGMNLEILDEDDSMHGQGRFTLFRAMCI